MKKNIPNIITATRLIGTIAMLFTEALSLPFFLFYVWCGISDILDGYFARKFNAVSTLGSKLDSISDLTFYTVMMLKVMKYLRKYFPAYIWTLIYIVLFVRFVCYVIVYVKGKYFESRHTIYNKATATMMFFLPFFIKTKFLIPYSLLILTVAYIAAGEEILHLLYLRNKARASAS